MRQKRTDLVKGRLGTVSPAEQDAADEVSKKHSNYGVERLGIAMETQPEPLAEVSQQSSPKAEQAPAPPPRRTPQPKARVTPERLAAQAIQAQAVAEPVRRRRPELSVRSIKALIARRFSKRTLLLAGGLGGLAVVGLIVLCCWSFGGEGATPQTASAGEGPRQGQAGVPGRVARPGPAPGPGGTPTGTSPPRPARPPQDPNSSADPVARARPGSSSPSPAVSLSKMAFSEVLKLLARSRQQPPKTGPSTPTAPPEPGRPGGGKPIAFRVCPPGISLNGIMQGPDGPVAMINNQLVTVGDIVNKAKVVRIGKLSVELELDGQRFLVGISTPTSHRPPPVEAPKEETATPKDNEK